MLRDKNPLCACLLFGWTTLARARALGGKGHATEDRHFWRFTTP
jgi:hypothetical protein